MPLTARLFHPARRASCLKVWNQSSLNSSTASCGPHCSVCWLFLVVEHVECGTVIASDSDANISMFRLWKSPSLDPRCQVNGGQSKHRHRYALILRREKSEASSSALMPLPDAPESLLHSPIFIYLHLFLSLMCRFFRRRRRFRVATWTLCIWVHGRLATGQC